MGEWINRGKRLFRGGMWLSMTKRPLSPMWDIDQIPVHPNDIKKGLSGGALPFEGGSDAGPLTDHCKNCQHLSRLTEGRGMAWSPSDALTFHVRGSQGKKQGWLLGRVSEVKDRPELRVAAMSGLDSPSLARGPVRDLLDPVNRLIRSSRIYGPSLLRS